MRIRRDSVFIASVLFTIALLCLVPWHWREVTYSREVGSLESLDAGSQLAAREAGQLGVASLVIILIGLIVTWKGYLNRLRWAWLVMFIITWVWAFPLLALPLLTHKIAYTFPEVLYDAMHGTGPPRDWTESVSIFLLMVIALLLPAKSFLFGGETPEPAKRSPRQIGVFAVSVLIVVVALLAWVEFQVYEIPPTAQWENVAPPPPPNSPSR
jgi:hypothetical protein